VTQTVQAYGTGGLNIAACQLPAAPGDYAHPGNTEEFSDTSKVYRWAESQGKFKQSPPSPGGRWPANVILAHRDDCEPIGAVAGTQVVAAWRCAPGCPVAAMDTQTGERPSTLTGRDPGVDYTSDAVTDGGLFGRREQGSLYGDTGGASRFYYCPKANRAEREAGLRGLPLRARPTMGNGIGGQPDQQRPNNLNIHPTVKPVDAMRWLCRLVCPPGGRILDPFCGSGSTGVAAVLEGFHFDGFEREPEYVEIAALRILDGERRYQPSLF
jgi:hypothetical protein